MTSLVPRTAENGNFYFLNRLSQTSTSSCACHITAHKGGIIIPSYQQTSFFSTTASTNIWNILTGLNKSVGPALSDGTIVYFAKIDGWMSTVTRKLSVENTKSGVGLIPYGDPFCTTFQLAPNQILGSVRRPVEFWDPQQFYIL